jgi:hypothetical protein
LPGNDDNDLERELPDEHVEAGEEMTPAEARWVLKVALALALLAGVVAFSGVGTVSNSLRANVLSALEQVRDSSAAALRSAVGESASQLGAVASKVGAVAGEVGAVPNALGGDVVGALQQARDSSTAALRSAVGERAGKQFRNGSHEPFHKQYHSNVFVCLQNFQHDVKALVYVTRSVSTRSVPSLVSQGAIYPVPAGGCS